MSVVYGQVLLKEAMLEEASLEIMRQRLNHWNADATGAWRHGPVGLGHLMLFNTHESLKEQLPFYDPITRLTLTADARIDNRKELALELNIPPREALTLPDSLFILKAYQQWGEACPEHLMGDFAFAIWDDPKQLLFCARDHMGVKPFFYYKDQHRFAFASEKKGILVIPGTDQSINQAFLYRHLLIPPEQPLDATLYRHIHRLPPAHTLVLHVPEGAIKTRRYWTLNAHAATKLPNKKDYIEGFLHHFEEAIQCRVRSAFPVGTELSGGLDSSAITGVACHFLGSENITTFSNVFEETPTTPQQQKMDERVFIDEAIRFNNITHAVFLTGKLFPDPVDEADFMLEVNDGLERWNASWQLPSRKAAQERNIRSMLSGFPGDQMVTSLSKTYYLDYFHKKQYLKYFRAKQTEAGKFNKLHPFIPPAVTAGIKSMKTRLGIYPQEIKQANRLYQLPKWFKKQYKPVITQQTSYKELHKSYRHTQKNLLFQPMVAHRLEGETRQGIYFRQEPRFPMADIRLTQYFSALPNEFKYGGGRNRDFYKTAISKYIPAAIAERQSKAGTVAPFMGVEKEVLRKRTLNLLENTTPNPIIRKITPVELTIQEEKEKDNTRVWRDNALPGIEIIRWIEKNGELLQGMNDKKP